MLIDQEYPPDGLQDFASEDEQREGAEELVHLHKSSIKVFEDLLKREKEMLVEFATCIGNDDDIDSYVRSLELLCAEKIQNVKQVQRNLQRFK